MDSFAGATVVRLRGAGNLYLAAHEDRTHVLQLPDGGSSPQTQWTVHCVVDNDGHACIHLVSCYDSYLLATRCPSFLGLARRKVRQGAHKNDGTFWMPEQAGNGNRFRLRSRWGYLWVNCRTCSFCCSPVTCSHHGVALRLYPGHAVWDVEIVKSDIEAAPAGLPPNSPLQNSLNDPPAGGSNSSHNSPLKAGGSNSSHNSPLQAGGSNSSRNSPLQARGSNSFHNSPLRNYPPAGGSNSSHNSPLQNYRPAGGSNSSHNSPLQNYYPAGGSTSSRKKLKNKIEFYTTRTIFYAIVRDDGEIYSLEWSSFAFRGFMLQELIDRMKDETKLDDITIHTMNPVNQMLIPFGLQMLPPGTSPIRFYVLDNHSGVLTTVQIETIQTLKKGTTNYCGME